MKIQKGYVKNSCRPKAYTVERYIVEEAVKFCSNYLDEVEAIGLFKSCNKGRVRGKGICGVTMKSMGCEEVRKCYKHVYMY